MADGGGFEPPVPFGTHAFQACTIDRSVTHPVTTYRSVSLRSSHDLTEASLQLQPPEQFVERQLDADVEFAEIRVFGAHRIETHFVNDRFDLERIARKQRHAPFRVVQTGRTGDELFHFAGELAPDIGVAFHQFAALLIRQRVPVPLFAAALVHVIKTNDRPIGQRRINALLPVMFHPLAKRRPWLGRILRDPSAHSGLSSVSAYSSSVVMYSLSSVSDR